MKAFTFLTFLVGIISLMLSPLSSAHGSDAHAHKLKVGSLHPLIGDLLRQVGGEKVEVVDIVKVGDDLHHFRPKGSDAKAMASCKMIFASGKGFETYLGGLQDSLGKGRIYEVGRYLPSQKVDAKSEIYSCCPQGHHGNQASAVDPHWWHNVDLMRRAAGLVAKELGRIDSVNAKYYKTRGKEVEKQLKALDRWVKAQVSTIPRDRRRLVTAHGAFGYFCKAYGFKASFVQGLNKEGEISGQQLVKVIEQIRSEKVSAVFAEKGSNPKVLAQIAKQSGAKVGKPLIADGGARSYQAMIQANVGAVVEAMAVKKP